jgi:hypothetical protein
MRGPAFFAYADNYLIDVKFGIIMDVEASRAIRQAEVGAAKSMTERTEDRFEIKPERLAADTAYGSGANLDWLVNEKKIAPHIPVIDKSKREDGAFSREDFRFDKERDVYICPAGKTLRTTGTLVNDGETLFTWPACATVAAVCSRRSVARRRLSAGCRAASTRRLATLLASWPRLRHSNDRGVTENALRCCLLISSAFCGLGVCDCVGRAALSSSSRWQRSRRTFAGWPSSSPARHR